MPNLNDLRRAYALAILAAEQPDLPAKDRALYEAIAALIQQAAEPPVDWARIKARLEEV